MTSEKIFYSSNTVIDRLCVWQASWLNTGEVRGWKKVWNEVFLLIQIHHMPGLVTVPTQSVEKANTNTHYEHHNVNVTTKWWLCWLVIFVDIIKFQDLKYFLLGGILKIDKSISLISLNISDSSQKIKSFILPDLKRYILFYMYV